MKLVVDGRRIDAPEIVLGPTSRASVHLGALEIRVARAERAPTVLDRLRDVVDARLLRLSGIAFALHAGFVALLFLAHPPDHLDDLQAIAPRFATMTPHTTRPVHRTTATTKTQPTPTSAPAVRVAHASTRHRVLDDARSLARAALAELHLDAGATSSVVGASGPSLAGIRGASFGGGDGGFGTRATGAGGGGAGIGIGGLDGAGSAFRDADRGLVATTGVHKPAVVGTQRIVYVGALDRDEIQRVVSRAMAQIKYCYEKELNAHPALEGKLVTSWIIAGDGSVATTSIAQNTLGDDVVGSCVTRVIGRLKFPAPKGNGQVVVTYPFVFSSSGT